MLVKILIVTHNINSIVIVWACFTTSINLRQLTITIECGSTEFKIGGQFVRIPPFGTYLGHIFYHFYELVKLLLSAFHILLRHRHPTNWRCCELQVLLDCGAVQEDAFIVDWLASLEKVLLFSYVHWEHVVNNIYLLFSKSLSLVFY